MLQAAKPIRRTSLVDEIAANLQEGILRGDYPAGSALPPERELSERLGVTRTSLKHALVRLEQMGLIETRHGVGSVVKDVQQSGGADLLQYLVPADSDRSFLSEVIEARTHIVAAFAALAAVRRTEHELEDLQEIADRIAETNGRAEELQRLENDFLRTLARASHNRTFTFLTNSVTAAYKFYWNLYTEIFADGAWVEEGIGKLFEAVRARDPEGARAAARAYLTESDRRLLERVSKKGKRGRS